MIIHLNWHEQYLAAQVGLMRHFRAMKDGRRDSAGLKNTVAEGLVLHIEGAMGEMAFAKAFGVYWDGSIDTFKAADVGRVQVRTRSDGRYQLLVRQQDADADAYVLVRGHSGDYAVVGWLYGREAKREEWLAAHGGRAQAYFVPDSNLRPVAQLKACSVS